MSREPAENAAAVTPADGTNLSSATRGLLVGVSGDVKVTMAAGGVVTLKNMVEGVVHPLQVIRVWSTGTTATNIIAMF